jgi:predicted NAD/FAD-dependent oxidoreductase
MIKQHIAVIGAGIAGLSCATALQKTGHSVELFDKGRGIGGRLSTRRNDFWQCDHGAQYFTARHPDFILQVEQWIEAGVVAVWEPVMRVYQEGQWSSPQGSLKRFVGIPGMSAPARAMAQGLSVQTSTTIQSMSHTDAGWQLTSTEHGMLPNHYSKIVFAIPPLQVGAILGSHSKKISTVADSIVMQPCWTVLMQFAAPLELPFEAAFINTGPLSWVARNSSKPGRKGQESWVMHATPTWTQEHLELKAKEIGPLLIDAFQSLGGPLPATWSAHRWRYASSDTSIAIGSVLDTEKAIGICGDWLNGGRVEGAWLSGQALANEIR